MSVTKKHPGKLIDPTPGTESRYRYNIRQLAWEEMMWGQPPQITPEEFELYNEWMWEASRDAK